MNKVNLQETKNSETKAIQSTRTILNKDYIEAVGRRKTSSARVRLYIKTESDSSKNQSKDIIVNQRPYKKYFPTFALQKKIELPFNCVGFLNKFGTSIKVKGGGIASQAGACVHGIARAFVLFDPLLKQKFKKDNLLTRDSRMRERKKFGLKRARRAPQWSKR